MTINRLDTGGYFMHQRTLKYCTFCSQFACMLICGSQKKERLFPYTVFTDWIYSREGL